MKIDVVFGTTYTIPPVANGGVAPDYFSFNVGDGDLIYAVSSNDISFKCTFDDTAPDISSPDGYGLHSGTTDRFIDAGYGWGVTSLNNFRAAGDDGAFSGATITFYAGLSYGSPTRHDMDLGVFVDSGAAPNDDMSVNYFVYTPATGYTSLYVCVDDDRYFELCYVPRDEYVSVDSDGADHAQPDDYPYVRKTPVLILDSLVPGTTYSFAIMNEENDSAASFSMSFGRTPEEATDGTPPSPPAPPAPSSGTLRKIAKATFFPAVAGQAALPATHKCPPPPPPAPPAAAPAPSDSGGGAFTNQPGLFYPVITHCDYTFMTYEDYTIGLNEWIEASIAAGNFPNTKATCCTTYYTGGNPPKLQEKCVTSFAYQVCPNPDNYPPEFQVICTIQGTRTAWKGMPLTFHPDPNTTRIYLALAWILAPQDDNVFISANISAPGCVSELPYGPRKSVIEYKDNDYTDATPPIKVGDNITIKAYGLKRDLAHGGNILQGAMSRRIFYIDTTTLTGDVVLTMVNNGNFGDDSDVVLLAGINVLPTFDSGF